MSTLLQRPTDAKAASQCDACMYHLVAALRLDELIYKRNIYFNGMNLEECVAPMPGFPCLTGLYEMENSAR